jgi:endonuclease YncB( thermonuclease family)
MAAEWVHEGRVVRVKDGDTFVMLDRENTQHEVRFAGSDSPEKRQPFYQVSGTASPGSSLTGTSRHAATRWIAGKRAAHTTISKI